MSSRLLLLFLSTFLLVQSSLGNALPLTEGPTTLKPDLNVIVIPEPPKIKILFYVVSEFSELADHNLNTGKKLLQDVITDISATDNKDAQTTARLEEYSKLVEKIEKIQTEDNWDVITNKFELMVEFGDLLDKSNVTLIENPTNTDKLFDESLKKHGLNNLEQDFEEKFETFAKDFNETAERILNSATIEEMPEKTKIQDWLRNFMREKDVEKKVTLFGAFFDFFE